MYLTGQPRGVTPYPFESWKGVVPYEYIYEEFMVILTVAILIVTILNHRK